MKPGSDDEATAVDAALGTLLAKADLAGCECDRSDFAGFDDQEFARAAAAARSADLLHGSPVSSH